MSAGHVGKWKVRMQESPYTEAQLQNIEKEGYVIVSIAANAGNHFCYARYRGGHRAAASG